MAHSGVFLLHSDWYNLAEKGIKKHMKEFYIDDDGIRLHAKLQKPENAEKCPLLIVVHGLTGHMEERHIKAAVDAANEIGFASLRVEMYGHGQSGGDFEKHTIFKWIGNIMTVIDYAKTLDFVTDLYLCGHSQGGMLTMIAAGMRPDDLKGIIPMSPALVIPDGARKGGMLGMTFDPEHIPDVIDGGKAKLSGDYFRTAQLIHIEDSIHRYHGPVLITHGDADPAVPVQYSIDAAEEYENCRLVILPDDNHGYDLHLDRVLDEIKAFLKDSQ